MTRGLLFFSLPLLFSASFVRAQHPPVVSQFHVVREWRHLNFTWPDEETYNNAIARQLYTPDNCILAGVKQYEGYFYLTLPRMKTGVPATLARISAAPNAHDTAPLLEPYPSWRMNALDDCDALQNVQNVEVDAKGRMWVVDGGHTNTLSPNPIERCPPKLVVLDVHTNKTTSVYTFPDNVASAQFSFLYDLVVDDTDGGYAYITDNSGRDPGIVVYSARQNKAWKLRDDRTMRADPSALELRISDVTISSPINLAAIALGPKLGKNRPVYFCPLSSMHLFTVNSSALMNDDDSPQFSSQIRDLGLKGSQTASMVMDSNGVLYYGLLGDTSIARWDSRTPFQSGQKTISRDKEYLQWVSSFSFDNRGNLTVLTNKLQKFISGKMFLDQPNFRLMTAYVGGASYLYDGGDGQRASSSLRPDVAAGAEERSRSSTPWGASTDRVHVAATDAPVYRGVGGRNVGEAAAVVAAVVLFLLVK